VARLSAEVKARDPSVPWQDIMGLRNILVHEYLGIYWPLVWQTAVDHAPVLRDRIAASGVTSKSEGRTIIRLAASGKARSSAPERRLR
jgi:uncharacterized protein with HEPN domain